MFIAGAISYRWMVRRTTSGDRLLLWSCGLVLSGAMLLETGCASRPSVDPMQQQFETAQRNLDVLVRQARTEASALRTELAEAKIAAAKQSAELEELRQQIGELRQTVEAKQAEHAALRTERDRLNQLKSELQAQLVEVPLLRQSLTDAKAGETRALAQVKQLESALVTAMAEAERLKKGTAVSPSKAGRSKKRNKTVPKPGSAPGTPESAGVSGPQSSAPKQAAKEEVKTVAAVEAPQAGQTAPGLMTAAVSTNGEREPHRYTVQRDETLWRIARRFHVSVEQMLQVNGLQSSMIREGQTLVIPDN